MAQIEGEGGRGPRGPRRQIKDNPSQKADLAAAWIIEWVVRNRRYVISLTHLLGPAGRETREMLLDPELMGRVEAGLPLMREQVGLPDRFNALLGPRGWTTFEEMDVVVVREAVLLAGAGDLEGAEGVLVRHFAAETLRDSVERLCEEIPEFGVRKHLLLAAVEDHREGRYHASVPVALSQLDGAAHDLTGHTFFVRPEKADHLILRDSISGHPTGLAALAGTMSRGWWKTSVSETHVPYRHSIMHGRDLGYANQITSAKSMAALLALGSWALDRDRNGRDTEPPFAPFDPSDIRFKELARSMKGAAGVILRAWFSRSLS